MSNTHSAELVPYNNQNPKPFVFVSYSHDETVKVEGVLRLMQRAGIRFWYDQQGAGIGGGSSWRAWVRDRMEKSSMFLCFLANGVEQRREVLNEIEEAIDRREKNPDYRVLFIFLEKMPARVFVNAGAPKIEAFIRDTQYIMYRGITDRFIGQLPGRDVFPDTLIRADALDRWKKRAREPLTVEPADLFPENPYICETVFPELDSKENFYKVRMDQMDPDAVCLICLDNQWCPPEFYNAPHFWKYGLHWKEGEEMQRDYQTKEVFRALLHHRQIVVNRAFLYNSHVFEQWYRQGEGDKEAFRELLRDGTLLVYLTTESAPFDANNPPRFATANYEAWGEICRQLPVFCVRMDWTDAVTNRLKVEELLFHRFENFCLTMAENRHLQSDMADAFGLDQKQRRDFAKIWQDVQLHAAARDREEHPSYTRERFYRQFLVRPKTDVSDGILDIHKAFAPELKEIVDLQYGLNLPAALGIRAIFPALGNLKDFYRSGQMLEHGARELAVEELSCAVGEFWPDFLQKTPEVDFPEVSSLSLDEIVLLRKMPEWRHYIRTVSNGSKRAHLQEVDFYDIAPVWSSFCKWMEAARERTQNTNRVQWRRNEGTVSVIYRLGNQEIITVYHAASNEITIRSTLGPGEAVPADQDHTVLVTIDYVCANVLNVEMKDNFMLSEQRLFEGMSKERLSVMVSGLMERLHQMEAGGQICLRWDQKTPEELRIKREYREKAESSEWRAYVEWLQETGTEAIPEEDFRLNRRIHIKEESGAWKDYLQLMQERQKDFRQDAMLEIVTDLEEVCKYERSHPGVTIGVRYRSPYSLLVVDLVRDTTGRLFSYERVMPAVPRGAVVCVCVYQDRYVMIEQFRHSMRGYQLSFPRGYAEAGLTGEENARKETEEELGTVVLSTRYLGQVVADSGVSGNRVEVYLCQVDRPVLKPGYEGIHRLVFLTRAELEDKMKAGDINDGYSLAALGLLESK